MPRVFIPGLPAALPSVDMRWDGAKVKYGVKHTKRRLLLLPFFLFSWCLIALLFVPFRYSVFCVRFCLRRRKMAAGTQDASLPVQHASDPFAFPAAARDSSVDAKENLSVTTKVSIDYLSCAVLLWDHE